MEQEEAALKCIQVLARVHLSIPTGKEMQTILQGKMEIVAQMKGYIEKKLRKKRQKDTFTIEGGPFALKSASAQSEDQHGSLSWIIDRRRFIESLAGEEAIPEEEHPFIQKTLSLTDIAVELESGQITSDPELANRLLIYCNNRILADQLADKHVQYIEDIRGKLL